MKRTGFKRKPNYPQMKRTPLKRGKSGSTRHAKTDIRKLKDKLWELCKQITRLKYGNTCYTCGATGLSGGNWHTAHFIASSIGGASLRYHLDNLRPGCYRCNVSLAGNGAMYYKNLVDREGQNYVDNLFKIKQEIIKADKWWYEDKIQEYQIIYETLLRMQETMQ